MTKGFIIKSLLKYKLNKEECAIDSSRCCVYLSDDGKMCALGQYMKKGDWQNHFDIITNVFKKFGEKKIMHKKWLNQKIPLPIAKLMQSYHDYIARGVDNTFINDVVEELEEKTKFKLKKLYV
jgi:hypothetical protein